MSGTPDISKIVSIIMQNPALISQIAALAGGTDEAASEPVAEEETVASAPEAEKSEAVATTPPQPHHNKARRRELLNAMKPYLSEGRRGALDSMASILDILDVMVRKET